MATYTKQFLSGSTNGLPLSLYSTSSQQPDTIHTTQSSDSIKDEIWVYANNMNSTDAKISLFFENAPAQEIVLTIPGESGLTLVIPGLVVSGNGQAGNSLKAYLFDQGNYGLVNISGYVNRIS